MVMAPIVYFRNFIDVFFHYLNLYDSCGKLIWHDIRHPSGGKNLGETWRRSQWWLIQIHHADWQRCQPKLDP